MSESAWRIALDSGGEVSAVLEPAMAGAPEGLFVFAHGAGGHMADRGVLRLASMFRQRGLDVIRFNFPYRESGSGRPDSMPVLKACVRAVVMRALEERHPRRLILGGRSMGGRASSMLAADGFPCEGLLLLAYPLHPAGRPDKLRDTHLVRIAAPVLCFNGTRDTLCRQDLMQGVVDRLTGNWRMHWLDGADHSFHVTRRSGRNDEDVLDEIGRTTQDWLAGLPLRAGER